MTALVATFRVIGASAASHQHDCSELFAAVFAGVSLLLAALIQLVPSLIASVGMAHARAGYQRAHVGKLVAAIFAVIHSLLHSLLLLASLSVRPRRAEAQREQRHEDEFLFQDWNHLFFLPVITIMAIPATETSALPILARPLFV